VTVALTPGVDLLEIRVTDEGRRTGSGHPPAGRPAGNGMDISAQSGRGILGMRERCQLLGGDLDAGPTPEGGFEVTARLPLAPTGSRL